MTEKTTEPVGRAFMKMFIQYFLNNLIFDFSDEAIFFLGLLFLLKNSFIYQSSFIIYLR